MMNYAPSLKVKAQAELELRKRRAAAPIVHPATRSLLAFTQHTKPDYHVGWHHRALCAHLDRFVAGEVRRLMVFMPPRHGKSELVSRRLPAYILGRDPNATIIASSYSADLASRMNRDVQRIIDTPEYAELFPDTQLYGKNIRTTARGAYLRNSDIFEVVGHMGVYRSAGVGGGITGMGGQYLIIDDPIKNREEADSATYREALWEWYTSTFYTRLEKDGAILVTLTRWHEDDLAGRLLAMADTSADQWTVLRFPATAEPQGRAPEDCRDDGEPLWPEKYDAERLATIRTTVGSRQWEALYQQRPAPADGGMIKRAWWKFYKVPPPQFDRVVDSWDMTFKDTKASDYVAGQKWGKVGADAYLLARIHDRMDFTTSQQAVKNLAAIPPQAPAKLIEDKANGPAIIASLQRVIPGLIPVEPQGSKQARAAAVSPFIEAGNVFLPDPSIAPWIEAFIAECAAFPLAAHDDDVDAMSQALARLFLGRTSSAVGAFAR